MVESSLQCIDQFFNFQYKKSQFMKSIKIIPSLCQSNLLIFFLFQSLRRIMDLAISHLAASKIKPLSKESGLSLHQLSKWNQHLDGQRLKTIYLQQDIKKQQKLAKKNSLYLNKQVQSIERQAVGIASELQEEKTKYQHLVILVRNAQKLIQQEKLDKYEEVMNKKEPDQFEECKKNIIENEKKLEKILQKLNSSEFEISKKIDLIRSLRSERGIHSNVFDKLQKEHFDVEFFYKQLLIQRTLLEKQLQKCVVQFNHLYQTSTQQYEKMNLENRQLDVIQASLKEEGHRQKDTRRSRRKKTFRANELTFRDKDFHASERFKSKNDLFNGSKILEQKNLDETRKLEFKKKLKSVLNELGCESFSEVIQKNVSKRLSEEDFTFNLSNKICDQIFSTQNQIKNLENQLQRRKNINTNRISSKNLNLLSQISEFQAESNAIKTQVAVFKNQFEKIVKNIVSSPKDQQQSLSFSHYKSISKDQSSQTLTFFENQQLLKQIMAFFNDQILDTFIQEIKINICSKSKVFGDKSAMRKKHKKMSSLGLDKKVRIMKTETDNSNQSSYSIRNEECLDTILSMQTSANQKFQKGEKTDNLTILTEDELIQESKRLIRQVKKKKSEFLSNLSLSKKEKMAV